jgi:hypothetical protein
MNGIYERESKRARREREKRREGGTRAGEKRGRDESGREERARGEGERERKRESSVRGVKMAETQAKRAKGDGGVLYSPLPEAAAAHSGVSPSANRQRTRH